MYEATASYHNGVKMTTYVLNDNADEVINNLQTKLINNERIEKADLISLILTPLMDGTMSQKERIGSAFDITYHVTSVPAADIRKIEAMVYAMADKFLDSWDLEEIREEIKMTRLGAMLYNDGIGTGERQKLKELVKTVYQKGMSMEKISELFNESIECIAELIKEIERE